MADSREAQFKRGTTEAITAYGWEVGIAGGCEHTGGEVSERDLTHYYLTKHNEKRLRLEGAECDYGLIPVSEVGTDKPHDPEKQRLAKIIDRLDDLYGAEVSDDDKLHFAHDIVDRIERNEAVMAQV